MEIQTVLDHNNSKRLLDNLTLLSKDMSNTIPKNASTQFSISSTRTSTEKLRNHMSKHPKLKAKQITKQALKPGINTFIEMNRLS